MPRLSEATAPTERNTLLENTAYSVSCLRCLQVWFPVLSICSNFSFIFCFFCEMICCMYHLVLGHQVRTLTYATTLPSSCILNFVKTQTMRLCFQSHPLYVVSFTHNLPTNNPPPKLHTRTFFMASFLSTIYHAFCFLFARITIFLGTFLLGSVWNVTHLFLLT